MLPLPAPEDFLAQCAQGSTAAYEGFKSILGALENEATRAEARRLLGRLEQGFEEAESAEAFMAKNHFTFERLATSGEDDDTGTLTLLQLPSIFTPEEWSFTFYEGLARYPIGEFQGRVVAELGCGNGWISIALAKRCAPLRMVGLDINPRAVVCARINLYLNALNTQGNELRDADGKSLLDRVEFHVSDLLGVVKEKGLLLDRVVGCIPQVLSPDPAAALRYVSENASDEFLHSLSNYCERQGFVEDQFGLGLIARALEEAVDTMKPSAKVILNMGGRPGHAVLARLFTRRGFQVRTVWQTKVMQAGDTDIDALVEIEKSSPHRFEFYMGLGDDVPVSAKTAAAYAVRGGEISHALSVYEGQLKSHGNVGKIVRLLRRPGFEDARSALDLTFEDAALAEEKTSFLAALAEDLERLEAFPYDRTEGQTDLRRRLAEFFRSYWRVPLTAKNFLVAPGRGELVKNILFLYRPKLALVDRELAASVRVPEDVRILEAPRRVAQLCKLIEKLQPEIVVCGLADFEVRSVDSFERLVEACGVAGARLFVDISPHFDLSSAPAANAVLSRIATVALPPHVALLCGLVKNRVYADLEVCFLLTENADLLEGLTHAAEFSYSRTPLLAQSYYDRILFDLLNFQMTGMRKDRPALRMPQAERPAENAPVTLVKPAATALRAFAHPAIAASGLPITAQTIRLDYGENELPAPRALHSAVFEAFARQNVQGTETDVSGEIANLMEQRFGLQAKVAAHTVLGGGVAPLFAALAEECLARDGVFVFAAGAYGFFRATCDFIGTRVAVAETTKEQGFKLTPKALQRAVAAHPGKKPWLYLNAPVVNPTGAVYSPGEIADLLSLAHSVGAVVVMDTVFSGLEFQPCKAPLALEEVLESTEGALELVILGGLSKEFSGGGLRFGFAFTRSAHLAAIFRGQPLSAPHSTLRYAAKRVYAALNGKDPELHADLAEQRGVLRDREIRLRTTLESSGWNVVPSLGGLFLVASPTEFIGKLFRYETVAGETREVRLDAGNIHEALFHTENMLVNNDVWTGIPAYCRFVLAVRPETFERGLAALESFARRVRASAVGLATVPSGSTS